MSEDRTLRDVVKANPIITKEDADGRTMTLVCVDVTRLARVFMWADVNNEKAMDSLHSWAMEIADDYDLYFDETSETNPVRYQKAVCYDEAMAFDEDEDESEKIEHVLFKFRHQWAQSESARLEKLSQLTLPETEDAPND